MRLCLKDNYLLTTRVTMFRGNQYPCRDKGYLNQQLKQHYFNNCCAQNNTLRARGIV